MLRPTSGAEACIVVWKAQGMTVGHQKRYSKSQVCLHGPSENLMPSVIASKVRKITQAVLAGVCWRHTPHTPRSCHASLW